MKESRRKFFGTTAALAGMAIAPGLLLFEVPQAKSATGASPKVRWGMLVDTTRCAEGCDACVKACDKENGLSGRTGPDDSQWIRKLELKNKSTGRTLSLPVMCQHCAEPPCVDVCPTGASFKRADGIVLVDRHICIGCRYCMMACPYKARSFIHETLENQLTRAPRGKGCVESCTLCVHRVDAGEGTTACAEACAKEGHRAILFGDLKDPQSEIAKQLKSYPSVQIRADLGLNTGVRYSNI